MKKMIVLALALATPPAVAHDMHDMHMGGIRITQAWTRQTAPAQTVAGGFMTIANESNTEDRLIGAESPAAERVELHSMSMDGGIMRMRPVPEGIAIAAHGTAKLAPGGLHLMLIGLKKPIADGMVPVTLRFARAGKVAVSLMVEPVGASAPEEHHGHH